MPSPKIQAFADQYGITISLTSLLDADPVKDRQLHKRYESLDELVESSPAKAIARLEALIAQAPEEAELLNYLHIAHYNLDQTDQARQVLERTIRRHPDFLPGVLNYVEFDPDEPWIRAHGRKLGRHLEITDWPAQPDGSYFLPVFSDFEQSVIRYLLYEGRLTEAAARLNRLLEYELATEDEVDELIDLYRVQTARAAGKRHAMAQQKRLTPTVIPRQVSDDDGAYVLAHGELIDFLRRDSEEVTEAEVGLILRLPRETLVADLRTVVRGESVRQLLNDPPDVWEEEDTMIHAVYLLGALEAEAALPDLVDLLRGSVHTIDYFFGDFPDRFLLPTLITLARKQPQVLLDYLLEPNRCSYDRLLALSALAQIAFHDPERRPEILAGFRRVLRYFLDHPADRAVLDTNVVSFLVYEANKLRAAELLPLFREVDERGWIDPTVAGTLTKQEPEFHLPPDPADVEPLPATPHEYYSQAYRERRAESTRVLPGFIGGETPLDRIIMNQIITSFADGPNAPSWREQPNGGAQGQPVVRAAPKVGRNAPCPCGSGKKYKQCCLRKN